MAGDGDTRAGAPSGRLTKGQGYGVGVRTPFLFTRRLKVKPMKASTRKRAEEKLREVEGALKEAVGAAAKDRDLKSKESVRRERGELRARSAVSTRP